MTEPFVEWGPVLVVAALLVSCTLICADTIVANNQPPSEAEPMHERWTRVLGPHLSHLHLVDRSRVQIMHDVTKGSLNLRFPFQKEIISRTLQLHPTIIHPEFNLQVHNNGGVQHFSGAQFMHSHWIGGGCRFRVDNATVLVSGKFNVRRNNSDTIYTLQSAHLFVKWATLDVALKNLFDSRQHFDREARQLLFAYTVDAMQWPHNVHNNRTAQFSACGSRAHLELQNTLAGESQANGSAYNWWMTPNVRTNVRSRRSLSATQTTCVMAAVADFRYYEHHGSDLSDTVNSLLDYIAYADSNFRATQFGSYQGLGLACKTVIVYQTSSADPYYKASLWDVTELLQTFSRPVSPDTTGWGTVCLAHLFTYQDFDGGVQGLAWVANQYNGGICDGFGVDGKNAYLNTGLTTEINWGINILQASAELTVQHEIGRGSNLPCPLHNCLSACLPICLFWKSTCMIVQRCAVLLQGIFEDFSFSCFSKLFVLLLFVTR
eukprot:m.36610 g.36610  ORF g.36610 m.36610 type:complete len:491 (-) comp10025_c0_seq3:2928-4400(-)